MEYSICNVEKSGRITIPKNIRDALHIYDNVPLDIFIQDGNIVLKKHRNIDLSVLRDLFYRINDKIDGAVAVYDDTEVVVYQNDDLIKMPETPRYEWNVKAVAWKNKCPSFLSHIADRFHNTADVIIFPIFVGDVLAGYVVFDNTVILKGFDTRIVLDAINETLKGLAADEK